MPDKMLKFTDIDQQSPIKREISIRKDDFSEIYSEYIHEKAAEQSSRCSQCGIPFCQIHCPLSNNIPDWLKLTAEGRLEEAYELAQSTNNMPEVCGRICPQDRFVFEDGQSFDYSGDEESMKKQIEKINKNDVKGYENLVKFTEKIFNKGFSELSDVPFDKPLFMMKHIPSLIGLKSYKSVYSLVSSYVKNEKLRRMLSMHPLLVGGNPFTTTSIYGLILFLEKKWGIHYSMEIKPLMPDQKKIYQKNAQSLHPLI